MLLTFGLKCDTIVDMTNEMKEGVLKRLKSFLVDENVDLVPKIVYEGGDVYAKIDIVPLEDPVRNIYDEQAQIEDHA